MNRIVQNAQYSTNTRFGIIGGDIVDSGLTRLSREQQEQFTEALIAKNVDVRRAEQPLVEEFRLDYVDLLNEVLLIHNSKPVTPRLKAKLTC